MEINMRSKIFAVLITLVAALSAQAAAASEHHYTRSKNRVAINEQLRNSNAYAARADVIVKSDLPDYDDGAMASGVSGHWWWKGLWRLPAPFSSRRLGGSKHPCLLAVDVNRREMPGVSTKPANKRPALIKPSLLLEVASHTAMGLALRVPSNPHQRVGHRDLDQLQRRTGCRHADVRGNMHARLRYRSDPDVIGNHANWKLRRQTALDNDHEIRFEQQVLCVSAD
jgi:hypothetical protein